MKDDKIKVKIPVKLIDLKPSTNEAKSRMAFLKA